ncbi:hypothetical protein [Roseimicrobium sp. ORNL1]|uniref:hypothetical protein n=1 Tax=Roseimicrobium sp. ORNL1 TaxID=2711231 RepID=UPI0013E18808|nr:hypothetical protein [Roseimicrobium sp. ORNL1]QIE99985.1 hypothetical protein G5S37_00075 [Roseimicrobium sp. ORNL1]
MSKPHSHGHSHPQQHPHPQPHRHKRSAAPGEWASRNRSYVVTLGLIFAALAFVLWKLQVTGPDADVSDLSSQGKWEWSWQEQREQRPVWKSVLFYPSSGLGLAFLSTGLFASQGIVKKVAAATSLSWVTFPIRLLALPVQLVLSVFDKKR